MPVERNLAQAMLRNQAPGAWPKGARVVKVVFEEGDRHPLGSKGRVIASIGPLPESADLPGKFGYFVVWDGDLDEPMFVIDLKLSLDEGA